MGNLRNGAQVIVEEQKHFVSLLGVGTDRKLHVDLQRAFVGFGHVLGSYNAQRNQQQAANKQGCDTRQQFFRMLQAVPQYHFITLDSVSF